MYVSTIVALVLPLLDMASAVHVRSSRSSTSRRRSSDSSSNMITIDGCDCLKESYDLSSTKPNVWVFGDSIASEGLGYWDFVQEAVGDSANVLFGGSGVNPAGQSGSCGTSFGVVTCLPSWIGDNETTGKFDVISFNWGLHDCAPDLYQKVEDNEYVGNLMQIYSTLHDHLTEKGVIVWQSTTPVPPNSNHRVDDDVQRMNNLAATLWSKYPDVEVNNLYDKFVLACHTNASQTGYPANSSCQSMQQKDDVHANDVGRAFMGNMVGTSILDALPSS